MATILDTIVDHKVSEVSARKKVISESQLRDELAMMSDRPRGFLRKLEEKHAQGEVAIIAEIKKSSPSQGEIRADFDPTAIAKSYQKNGATCLSVLTDIQFFSGSPQYLAAIHKAVSLPILRKDFIIDSYQIIESRILHADCILLIAAILTDEQLHDYTEHAHQLGMDVLVEVHNDSEFDRALTLPIRAVGVNNRNLHDFTISLDTSKRLHSRLPCNRFLISESGFHCRDDILAMQQEGIHVFLVGEALMRATDPGAALAALISDNKESRCR